jgi:hypothetical protein
MLRRPRNKRPHFAHRPDSQCAGETALHRYAKELLEQAKSLTLPELTLRQDGIEETVCHAGTHGFDSVVIERSLDTFQPDAIVTLKGVALAVEYRVTHAVDEVKRAKVRERGLSMIEIDLSGVRAGRLDSDGLDRTILHEAPRQWIFHRRQEAAAKKLSERAEAERAARGARLRGHIRRKVRPCYPTDWRDEARESVAEAGLSHLVGLEVECGHWFAVPARVWQAAVLDICVVGPSQSYSPGSEVRIKGAPRNEDALANNLPPWMIRTDLSAYKLKKLEEAGYDRSSYGTPHSAVWHYLRELALRGEAVVWSGQRSSFLIEPGLHGRLHRRAELRRRVTQLLKKAGYQDPNSEYERWADIWRIGTETPRESIETGSEDYQTLSRALHAVESMANYHRKVADDLCGLPLEPLRDHVLQRLEEEAAAKSKKLADAVEQRRRWIKEAARAELEEAAAGWLAQIAEGEEVSWAGIAGESDDGLRKAERALAKAAKDRRLAKTREQELEGLRRELAQAARQRFPDPARANLFLNSAQHQLGGRRPIDYCDSRPALSHVLAILQKCR